MKAAALTALDGRSSASRRQRVIYAPRCEVNSPERDGSSKHVFKSPLAKRGSLEQILEWLYRLCVPCLFSGLPYAGQRQKRIIKVLRLL